jgi:hypothetical protein
MGDVQRYFLKSRLQTRVFDRSIYTSRVGSISSPKPEHSIPALLQLIPHLLLLIDPVMSLVRQAPW